MQATSINIQPIKEGSEQHNTRQKELSYVRATLTHLNESWQSDSIQNRLATIRENYRKTTGQAMQKKATPIREGVVVIQKNTTMKQLQNFAKEVEQKYGVKTIQIHIHRDEGHKKGKDWKPNLHAHFIFDWTQENGKSCKLNRQDMANLQTMLANSLNMKRGVSSDVKHLNAIQYKIEAEQEKLRELKVTKEWKELGAGIADKGKSLLGISKKDKKIETLQEQNTELQKKIEEKEKKIEDIKQEANRKINENLRNYKQEIEQVRKNKDLYKHKVEQYMGVLNFFWVGLKDAIQAIVNRAEDTRRRCFNADDIEKIDKAMGEFSAKHREIRGEIMIDIAKNKVKYQPWVDNQKTDLNLIANSNFDKLIIERSQNQGIKL